MTVEKIDSIRFENLTYESEDGLCVFEDLTFDFPLNSVVQVTGMSGAGMSTLLQILVGLKTPTKGSYWLNDFDVAKASFEEFSPYRLKIGYGFDMGGLINNQTIYQNLLLPLLYHNFLSHKEADRRVHDLMKWFQLEDIKNLRPAMILGGLRKATCVVRAMLLYPEILVLDEPTIGMSRDNVQVLSWYINQGRENGYFKHVFIATSDDQFMNTFDSKRLYIENRGIKRMKKTLKEVVS